MLEIVNFINKKTNLNIIIDKKLRCKPTARASEVYLCKSSNSEYLLFVEKGEIPKFYLRRQQQLQNKFSKFNSKFCLNNSIYSGEYKGQYFNLFRYFPNYEFCKINKPAELLNKLYELEAETLSVNTELLSRIEYEFLLCWPEKFYPEIKNLKSYTKYFSEISKFDEIKLFFEHGDFTCNNILKIENNIYLTDFEFSREFQPLGFDIYDYYKSLNSRIPKPFTYYEKLSKIKYKLISQINEIIDERCRIE